MKIDVLVEIYQGVLNSVRVLSHEEATKIWQEWADKHGYKNYGVFLKALNEGMPDAELRWFEDVEFKRPKVKETAHNIIDLVEETIRRENPSVETLVPQPDNTFLHGEAYYNLENEVVEAIE